MWMEFIWDHQFTSHQLTKWMNCLVIIIMFKSQRGIVWWTSAPLHFPNPGMPFAVFLSIPFIPYVVSGMNLIFKHIQFTHLVNCLWISVIHPSLYRIGIRKYIWYSKMNLILIKIQLNFHIPDNNTIQKPANPFFGLSAEHWCCMWKFLWIFGRHRRTEPEQKESNWSLSLSLSFSRFLLKFENTL